NRGKAGGSHAAGDSCRRSAGAQVCRFLDPLCPLATLTCVTDSGSTTPPEGTPTGNGPANPGESERPALRESLIVARSEGERGPSGGRKPKPARPQTSGDCLARALRAKNPAERRALAEAGLVRLDQ